MVKRNPNFSKLSPSYLFPEVQRRVRAFREKNPDVELISLSIGDTSEPLPQSVIEGIQTQAHQLGTKRGYRGYGPEQGDPQLREEVAEVIYGEKISPDEVFISDGAKCDIGRLQTLFGADTTIAVQDPTYPVYVDTGHLVGQQKIITLPCHAQNAFFPEEFPAVDLIYLCSPNNPTGTVATRDQLTKVVQAAQKNQSLIIFDAAYAGFIQDPELPRSIYEIEGAREVAIEVSSFSKLIGFTGVRLGWTIVPKTLCYDDGRPIYPDWTRIVTTFFNGASNLAQAGGRAVLCHGRKEIEQLSNFYLENARLIREALPKNYSIYGGENAPYLWVDFGQQESWELFEKVLEHTHVITTPGSGFGSYGEGYLRFSAFGSREHILEAVERIKIRWPANL